MPLVEYASYYRGIHAGVRTTALGKSLAINLLGRYDTHISPRLLLSKIYRDEGRLWDGDAVEPEGFTGLHATAFFGYAETLTSLRKLRASDLDTRDFTGRSSLIWTAVRGNLEVTKILLRLGGIIAPERYNGIERPSRGPPEMATRR